MTTVPRQLAIFAAVLAVLFAGGYAAGHIIGPTNGHGDAMPDHGTDGDNMSMTEHGGHAMDTAEHGGHAMDTAEHGLSAAENGLTLTVQTPTLARGRLAPVRFRITGTDGRPVRDYDVEHTKRLHLIIARRDLTVFQHLHPRLTADGTWVARTRLDQGGPYRLFADFSHGGTKTTLAGDLTVPGPAHLTALPAPAGTAETGDGYSVRLAGSGDATAGKETSLEFTVERDGQAVHTDPYLGAAGHLVALRAGDLAFLHVHPAADRLAFAAAFPTAGRYRLFLQFRHAGAVHTAAFTKVVG